MTRHDDLLYLGHMLDSAKQARELAQPIDKDQFDANEPLQLALTHLVQVIGEAARHISHAGREDLSTIPWHRIVGMRHRIVHDYTNVDTDIVWHVVVDDLPSLIDVLERVVPAEPPE